MASKFYSSDEAGRTIDGDSALYEIMNNYKI